MSRPGYEKYLNKFIDSEGAVFDWKEFEKMFNGYHHWILEDYRQFVNLRKLNIITLGDKYLDGDFEWLLEDGGYKADKFFKEHGEKVLSYFKAKNIDVLCAYFEKNLNAPLINFLHKKLYKYAVITELGYGLASRVYAFKDLESAKSYLFELNEYFAKGNTSAYKTIGFTYKANKSTRDSATLNVKLPYKNVSDFYADMRTLDRVGESYAIQAKGIQLLKQYMFKNNYGLFELNKPLIGIKGKEIFISEPIGDNSKKRQFIEKWIKEVKSKNNLEGEFSIQDFEKTVNKGEIVVSEK